MKKYSIVQYMLLHLDNKVFKQMQVAYILSGYCAVWQVNIAEQHNGPDGTCSAQWAVGQVLLSEEEWKCQDDLMNPPGMLTLPVGGGVCHGNFLYLPHHGSKPYTQVRGSYQRPF